MIITDDGDDDYDDDDVVLPCNLSCILTSKTSSFEGDFTPNRIAPSVKRKGKSLSERTLLSSVSKVTIRPVYYKKKRFCKLLYYFTHKM